MRRWDAGVAGWQAAWLLPVRVPGPRRPLLPGPVLSVSPTAKARRFAPSVASAAWTATPTPNAAGPRTLLSGVDCSSANSCIAVGVVDDGSLNPGSFRPVVERWDGTSWQITTLSSFGSLNGISCPQPSVCFAVGGSFQGPLIELWNGTSWSIQASPPGVNGELEDVSCSGLLACTAVGFARPDPNTFVTLAERWDGTGWHVQPTPNPTGSDNSNLYGVSCPLRRTCTAVGQSVTPGVPTDHLAPLLERWFGRVNAWGAQAAPQPEGAESVGLSDVSCPHGSRVCVVVGSSTPSQGQSSVMAARRIGLGSWSIFPLTTLPGSSLSTLDCPVVRFCQATGSWLNSLIAERFDGTNWHAEGIPTTGLTADVSCPSRFFCMAVGRTPVSQFGTFGTLAAKWTP
jgi:hypothetical protein